VVPLYVPVVEEILLLPVELTPSPDESLLLSMIVALFVVVAAVRVVVPATDLLDVAVAPATVPLVDVPTVVVDLLPLATEFPLS